MPCFWQFHWNIVQRVFASGLGLVQFLDLAIERKRLSNDLVHVVVLIGCETAGKIYSALLSRQGLIARIQLGIFRPRDGVVRIAIRSRIFIDQRGLCMFLPSEMLKLRDACVW